MKNQSIFLLILATVIFSACVDNHDVPPVKPDFSTVYTINEGNFGDQNGSITAYDPESKTSTPKAFEDVNSRPFAGFIQTATVIGDRLYIISNMTNKIEVMDLKTLSSVGRIDYPKTPVAITPAGEGQAYVTNLYDNSVTRVDLKQMQVTDETIAVGPNPYFGYTKNGKAFVSNNGFGAAQTVSVIDIQSGTVENTLTVGPGPKQIVEDPSGQLWVICEGAVAYDENGNRDPENDTPGGIYIINAAQQAVVDSVKNGKRPVRIALDPQDSRAYVTYAGDRVEQINLNTHQITDTDFIKRSFNTIGYSKDEHLLYLGQSNGLDQKGQVLRYNLQGVAVDSFAAGVSPIEFEFVKN